MALSMKNTFISVSLSGVMLIAGFLAGEQPIATQTHITSIQTSQLSHQSSADVSSSVQSKKNKRAFTTPYFSFGKSKLPVGVR